MNAEATGSILHCNYQERYCEVIPGKGKKTSKKNAEKPADPKKPVASKPAGKDKPAQKTGLSFTFLGNGEMERVLLNTSVSPAACGGGGSDDTTSEANAMCSQWEYPVEYPDNREGDSPEFIQIGEDGELIPYASDNFTFSRSDLDEGVTVTWKFQLLNCNSTPNDIRIVVDWTDDDPERTFFPDQTGWVTIVKTFRRNPDGTDNLPQSGNHFTAKVHYKVPGESQEHAPVASILRMPEILPLEQPEQGPCDWNPAPRFLTNIISPTTDKPKVGVPASFSVLPIRCDYEDSDLDLSNSELYFIIDGHLYAGEDLIQKEWVAMSDLAVDDVDPDVLDDIISAGGVYQYTVNHTFTRTGKKIVTAFARDRSLGSGVQELTFEVYPQLNHSNITINEISNDGFRTARPVKLRAGFTADVPEEDLTYTWNITVTNPDNGSTFTYTRTGRQTEFVPATYGDCEVTLTISSDVFEEELVQYKTFQIYEMSEPRVVLAGEEHPKDGESAEYTVVLLPNGRELGTEDTGATATATLWKLDPGCDLTDVDLTTPGACLEIVPGQGAINFNVYSGSYSFTFPEEIDLDDAHYFLGVDITGGASDVEFIGEEAPSAYEVENTFLHIVAHPRSTDQPTADILPVFHPDGAHPHREVTFNGTATNTGVDPNDLRFEWVVTQLVQTEITDEDGEVTEITTEEVVLASQPAEGISSPYTFTEAGAYNVTLNVYHTGVEELLASKTSTVGIWSFPKPTDDQVNIIVNGNREVVHERVPAHFFGGVARDWPEDENATYTWRISHNENQFNEETGLWEEVEIVDIDPEDPTDLYAHNRSFLYTFFENGTYTVELTIEGRNDDGEVIYTKTMQEFREVYGLYGGLPAVSIGSNLESAHHEGDQLPQVAGGSDLADDEATYNWTIVHTDEDGVTHDWYIENQKVLTSFPPGEEGINFHNTGNYFFKLEVQKAGEATRNFAYRNVDVYPPLTLIPSAAISGHQSRNIGDIYDITANSDDPSARYDWIVTPPAGPPITFENQRSISNSDLASPGDMRGVWNYKLIVTSSTDSTVKRARDFVVEVYLDAVSVPSAVISTNLEYSYHEGEDEANIYAYTDAVGATFNWYVTCPDGEILEFLDTDHIPRLDFEHQGDYDVKLEVVASDGKTKGYETRSVGIYDRIVDLPRAGIMVEDLAYQTGTGIEFRVPNADPTQFTYEWIFGDGTTATGAVPDPKAYTTAGVYSVEVIARRIDDPTIFDRAQIKMTLVPPEIAPPSFNVNIPYAGPVDPDGTNPMAMSIDNLANPDDWTVTWQYGDGSDPEDGASQSHSYTTAGKHNILVTLTSNIDPSFKVYIPFTTTIIPQDKPIPVVELPNGNVGNDPFTVIFDLTDSFATAEGLRLDDVELYIIDPGDGSAPYTRSTPVIEHTYDPEDGNYAEYTARITVVDVNGNENDPPVEVPIQVWPGDV
ncbi:PKD domain-containing protein [Candidatus Margulisiibacteriota bacterium]